MYISVIPNGIIVLKHSKIIHFHSDHPRLKYSTYKWREVYNILGEVFSYTENYKTYLMEAGHSNITKLLLAIVNA